MQKPSQAALPPHRIWLFNPEAMRDGDVVLEYGDTIYSRIIRAIDGGPFSHALIWAGNSDFVESVGGGVRILSFERVIIGDPAKWHMLRHADSEIGQRAADAARRMVGKYYNARGAIGSVIPGVRQSRPDALYCSELVAEAYLNAGIDLSADLSPNKVTPRVLLESRLLNEVPLPIIECDAHRRARALRLLNRDEAFKGSLMDKEAEVARAAFSAVKQLLQLIPPVTDKRLKYPPGNLHELIDLLASLPIEAVRAPMDGLLIHLRELGYFHLLEKPAQEVREDIFEAGMQLRLQPSSADGNSVLRADLGRRSREYDLTAQRYLRNAEICERLTDRSPHGLWIELAAMHRRNYQQLLILRTLAQDISSGEEAP
jgi:hypothetical protein